MSDEAEARRRRAARLREQIDELTTHRGGSAESGQDSPTPHPEQRRNGPRVRPPSPRSFIEQRMRELDQGERGKKD